MSSEILSEVGDRVRDLEEANKLLSRTTSMPNGSYKSALVEDLHNFINSEAETSALYELDGLRRELEEVSSNLRNKEVLIPSLRTKIARLESEASEPCPHCEHMEPAPVNRKSFAFCAILSLGLGIIVGSQLYLS